MSFSKRGIILLIATRLFACAFKRFLDFVLIVNSAKSLRSSSANLGSEACFLYVYRPDSNRVSLNEPQDNDEVSSKVTFKTYELA